MNTELINGGLYRDNRGVLKFFNDFDMSTIKRWYIVEHNDRSTIRAWQGHKQERKWFCVIDGSFKIVLVKPDDWVSPSSKLPYEEFVLNANEAEILCIPSGFATGFQALKLSSKLMIFSDHNLEDSLGDDFRFNKDLWYNWS